jgi:hypothetical protein
MREFVLRARFDSAAEIEQNRSAGFVFGRRFPFDTL